MKKVTTTSIILILVLLLTVGSAAAAPSRARFRAHLIGADAGVETLAQGQAIFKISEDGTTMHYKLIVANLDDVTMAHIHLAGELGGNGPPVVWLYPSGPPPMLIEGPTNGILAQGVVTAADLVGPLAGMTLDDLQMAIEQGLTYVNVHTAAYPGGEIRGTIR